MATSDGWWLSRRDDNDERRWREFHEVFKMRIVTLRIGDKTFTWGGDMDVTEQVLQFLESLKSSADADRLKEIEAAQEQMRRGGGKPAPATKGA